MLTITSYQDYCDFCGSMRMLRFIYPVYKTAAEVFLEFALNLHITVSEDA